MHDTIATLATVPSSGGRAVQVANEDAVVSSVEWRAL